MSPSPAPMSDAMVAMVCTRLKAMGEPVRIRLLDHLRRGPATVGELTDSVGTSHQNVSRHLARLHREGLLSREKAGNHVRYAIADPTVDAVCDLLCGAVADRIESLSREVRSV